MKKIYLGFILLIAACFFIYWTNVIPKKILKREMGVDVDSYRIPQRLLSTWDDFIGDGYSIWKFSKKSEAAGLKHFSCDEGFSAYHKKFNDTLSAVVADELGADNICFKEKSDPKLSERYLVFYNDIYVIFIIISQ